VALRGTWSESQFSMEIKVLIIQKCLKCSGAFRTHSEWFGLLRPYSCFTDVGVEEMGKRVGEHLQKWMCSEMFKNSLNSSKCTKKH